MEQQNKIMILNYKDWINLPSNKEQSQVEEDNMILKIAHFTNSILVTCDKTLRDKAYVSDRPVIYILGKILGSLKIIDEVRNP